jgi:hypothetical protein
MQNDKNINNENEFLKLVYGPPAYFNKMTIQELRADVQTINTILETCQDFSREEIAQLIGYQSAYMLRIRLLNKQYSI